MFFLHSGSSEDCLYLNVWAPAKAAKERLPVMVWIYGGGLCWGSTAGALTTGDRLASKGVIVVSVPYRVGPLGYLAHPGLSMEHRPTVVVTSAFEVVWFSRICRSSVTLLCLL